MEHFLYGDLSYKIRGSAFSVYNFLGGGHKESVYNKAIESEFKRIQLPYEKEKSLRIDFNNTPVGFYRPDFIIADKIIIELKAVSYSPQEHEVQLLHYLKSTGYKVGLLINFGPKKVYIKRLIWTKSYESGRCLR